MSTALAEKETSTDLVPVSDDVTTVARLTEAGNVDGLAEASARAEATQLYAERTGHAEQAAQYGRLKLLAEAGIGVIDLKAHPVRKKGSAYGIPPLNIGDTTIPGRVRDSWRLLGCAYLQGLLDGVLDELEQDCRFGLEYAAKVARRHGAGYVDAKPFAAPMKQWLAGGKTRGDLVQLAGVTYDDVYIGDGSRPLRYTHALALAPVLGLNPSHLRPRSKPPKLRPVIVKQTIPAPGLCSNADWKKGYTHYIKALQEFARVTGNNDPKYSDLWLHLNAASDIIGREVRK